MPLRPADAPPDALVPLPPDASDDPAARPAGPAVEHETAREQLAERTRELEAVFEALPDLYFRLDPTGVILDRRAGRAAVVRFRLTDIIGRRMQELLPEEVRPRFDAALAEACRTGELACVEYMVPTERGQRDFEARFVPIAGGDAVVSIIRDITDRTAAERALRAREEHFRRITENATDMVQIVDLEARILYTGPSVERLLGYTAEEIAGTSAMAYLHAADVPRTRGEVAALVAAPGVPRTIEYRVRRRDGAWRHFEANCVTLSPDGGEEGIVVNARDVTERKLAEEALRRNEERYRILIENTHDIITTLDTAGRFVYTTPAFERVLGYTPDEMLGRDAFEYVHPDDVPRLANAMRAVIASPGTTGHAEYRYRHKNGGWRRLETFGRTLAADASDVGIVLNTRDVTERVQAEDALRRSEVHFRAVTENASDLISVLDAEGRYRYQSPSIERVLGYPQQDVLGQAPWEFMHPDDVPAARLALERMVAEPGTSQTVQFRFRHKDGQWRVLESTGRTLLPDSADEGVVVISRDVTSRREAEEALWRATSEAERAREEAVRANHAKSEFLSRMSHELRTPLNSILGFAQLLAGAELDPRLYKGVQHILTAGEHLLNLINEVLDIARIESGRQQLSIEPVRLSTVMHEAIGLVRPLASARGVWVSETLGPAADRYVRADRQRLAQVLLNLLSNAVKYNRPGGQVRLSCTLVRAKGNEIRVRVLVEDSGRGIPADRVGDLFVPFARLGAETSEVEGTGLGLALSKRLVDAMGGELELDRTSEAGSTFRVDLQPAEDPLQEVAMHTGAWRIPVPEGTGVPATLLYVEDNLANLSLVEQILEARPEWKLVPALQGQLGVDLAREHVPDVVLLDLHLPDISGEEVLRQLRADPRTAHIPVVVISADATPKTVERLGNAGATAYLTKPLRLRQFISTIQGALAKRAAAP